jgi:hypothetical protein
VQVVTKLPSSSHRLIFCRSQPSQPQASNILTFWDKGEPCPPGAFMNTHCPFTVAQYINGSLDRSFLPPLS